MRREGGNNAETLLGYKNRYNVIVTFVKMIDLMIFLVNTQFSPLEGESVTN